MTFFPRPTSCAVFPLKGGFTEEIERAEKEQNGEEG